MRADRPFVPFQPWKEPKRHERVLDFLSRIEGREKMKGKIFERKACRDSATSCFKNC